MSRILIVEDDKNIAFALSTRLRVAGFALTNAYDALTGVSCAVKEPPDLVLLDLMMPAGGGIKVAERLRSLERTATVPIIFLSASKDSEMREQAMQYQPHAFFQKPYDAAELLASIQEALGGIA